MQDHVISSGKRSERSTLINFLYIERTSFANPGPRPKHAGPWGKSALGVQWVDCTSLSLSRAQAQRTHHLMEDTIDFASTERPSTKKGGSMTEASESSISPRGAKPKKESRSTESQRRNGSRQHQLGESRFGNVASSLTVLLVVSQT